MKIKPSFTRTVSHGTPPAAGAFALAALQTQAEHAGIVGNSVGIRMFTGLFPVLTTVSLTGFTLRAWGTMPWHRDLGYKPFSQLSKYTLGWYSGINLLDISEDNRGDDDVRIDQTHYAGVTFKQIPAPRNKTRGSCRLVIRQGLFPVQVGLPGFGLCVDHHHGQAVCLQD